MKASSDINMSRRSSFAREMAIVPRCYFGKLILVVFLLVTWLLVLVVIRYGQWRSNGNDVAEMVSDFDLRILEEEKRNLRDVFHELHELNERWIGPVSNDTQTTKPEPEVVDLRPLTCRMRNFGTQPPHTSLILDMHRKDYDDIEEYLLKIEAATSLVVIKEIFVIHGGLNLQYLRKDTRFTSFRALNFVDQSRIRQFHSNNSVLCAKIKAAKMAFGSILVFADGDVMWTKGWLQPLLVELEKDRKTVASPLFFPYDENVSSGSAVPRFGTGISWGLSTVLIEKLPASWDSDGLTSLQSPALRGHVFAVKKSFFKSLGYFEDQLEDGGGENVELSFKTWLCGGSIKIVPCSRIGIHFFYDPQKITNTINMIIISELWLDWYKKMLVKSDSNQPSQTKMYKIIEKRKTFQEMKCKSFYWYSENVPMSISLPHASAVNYGHLVSHAGRCATLGPDRQILLAQCLPGIHKPYMLFQLLTDGRLITLGLFLHIDADKNMVQQVYDETSPPALWVLTSAGQLLVRVNRVKHLCATEVGERVRAETCVPKKKEQIWKFVQLN